MTVHDLIGIFIINAGAVLLVSTPILLIRWVWKSFKKGHK